MSDTWWAAVRYTDGQAENVLVKKIKHFHPNNLTDYEQSDKDIVKTSAWNNEGKEEKYKAYIVRLAKTLPDLEKSLRKKRAHCPPLEVRDSDGPITTTQDEEEVIDLVEVQRDAEKQKRKRKKEVSDKMMGDIIEQAKRNKLSSSKSSKTASATPVVNQPSTSWNEFQDEEDKDAIIQHLREKVKMLEEELARKSEEAAVIDKLTDMEKKLKDVGNLSNKMTKIEKYLSEYETHYRYQYVTQWLQTYNDVSVDTNSENDS